MLRFAACFALVAFVVAAIATPQALAEKKKVLVTMTWKGSVADEKLQKDAPGVITDAKQLEKIWKDWKVKEDAPKIDFSKFIVVGVYSSGSRLNLSDVMLDEKGNLEVLSFGTRDLAEGFRYILGTVSNDGVVTVNGKKLPKE